MTLVAAEKLPKLLELKWWFKSKGALLHPASGSWRWGELPAATEAFGPDSGSRPDSRIKFLAWESEARAASLTITEVAESSSKSLHLSPPAPAPTFPPACLRSGTLSTDAYAK